MWKPKSITIKNFISHAETTFNFINESTLLIQGENFDDDFQDSNGSGKSAIIEAVAFNLTGSFIRKDIRVVDMVLEGENELETEFYLENKYTNQTLLIRRSYKLKKSQKIEIFINNKPIKKSDVNEYNKEILKILDISKDDLLNYFIISKEKYQSFLLSTDTKKKETISRFSNSNIIDGTDELVNADIQVLDNKISELERKLQLNEGSLIAYNKQLEDTSSEQAFEKEKLERIERIELVINTLQNSINEDTVDLEDAKRVKRDTEKELKKSDDLSEYEALLNETNAVLDEIKQAGKELRDVSKEYELIIIGIEKNLAGKVTCPKCNHEFSVADPTFNIKQAKKELAELKVEKQSADEEIKKRLESYKEVEKDKELIANQIKEIKRQRETLQYNLTQIERKILRLNDDITYKNSKINKAKDQIEAIKNEKYTNNSSKILKEIAKIEADTVKIQNEIDKINAEKSEYLEMIIRFKKFKTYLSNKSIKAIESYTNLYLSQIRTNLSIKLEGHKLLADNKTIREKITVSALRNGINTGPVGKFSSGERVRIDICNILALQNLINLNAQSGGLDLLLLDEIIESVDETGVKEILQQLNSLDKTICVITHAKNFSNFNNILTVRKENGISKIV